MTNFAGTRILAASLNASPIQVASSVLLAPAGNIVLSVPAGTVHNYLMVKWRARSSAAVAAEQLFIQFNSDTGSNYNWQTNEANAANAVSGTHSTALTTKIQIATITGASATSALWFASGSFDVGGTSDTTNYKTAQGSGTAFVTTTNAYVGTYGGQWNNAAAVTSIILFAATGNLVTGSMASMYALP